MRIRFALERDDDGWPPAESEGLWAEPVEGDLYRLDNTPWFVRGVAAGDVVEAQPDADGVLWFVQVRERGGRMAVRVIPRDDGPLDGDRQRVLDVFLPLGVGAEGMSRPVNMVALDIGPDAPLASVKSLLATANLMVVGTSKRGASVTSGGSCRSRQTSGSARDPSIHSGPTASSRLGSLR